MYFSASQILVSLRKLRWPPIPKLSPTLWPSTASLQREDACTGLTMASWISCHAPSAMTLSLVKASNWAVAPLSILTSKEEFSSPRQNTSAVLEARRRIPFGSRVRMAMVMLVTGLSKEPLATYSRALSSNMASPKPVEARGILRWGTMKSGQTSRAKRNACQLYVGRKFFQVPTSNLSHSDQNGIEKPLEAETKNMCFRVYSYFPFQCLWWPPLTKLQLYHIKRVGFDPSRMWKPQLDCWKKPSWDASEVSTRPTGIRTGLVCQILLHTGGPGISYVRYTRVGEMRVLISRGVLEGDNLHSYPSGRSTHCAPSKHGSLTHHKRVSHSRPEKSMGQRQLKSFQVIWHDPLFRHGSSCAPRNPDGWIRENIYLTWCDHRAAKRIEVRTCGSEGFTARRARADVRPYIKRGSRSTGRCESSKSKR